MILRSTIDLSIFTRIHGRKASIISFSFWDSISQTQVQAFFNFKIEPNNFFNTNMFLNLSPNELSANQFPLVELFLILANIYQIDFW